MNCTICNKILFSGDYIYGMCHDCVGKIANDNAILQFIKIVQFIRRVLPNRNLFCRKGARKY